MLSELGISFVLISTGLSFLLIYNPWIEFKTNSSFIPKKIFYLSYFQFFFTFLSFLTLLIGYIYSDFSLINVYENSHTNKPLLYKISGVWGNHEGSLLLWINILVLFSFLFFKLNKNTEKKFRLLTLTFQNILIFGFFLFLLTNSNPFSKIYPVPPEGMGLNPILQDPALAIHPPLLYLGFVGSSIYFSAALASLISKFHGNGFAKTIRPWVLISWFFQTIGILAGSIWAYYELGWGGYWFWDPVENSSLMPWFLMTALIHSVMILEKKNGIYIWVIILSILTFTISVTGTFLVRSGVLNSVHTFANDPSRGLFILAFLSLMVFLSLFIFFKNIPDQKKNFDLLGKEFFVLINNWFMIFFLIVVLIGTLYPIFLEVLTNQKISIGPPYYNIVLAPFVIPLLFLMSYTAQGKWIFSKTRSIQSIILIFVIFTIFVFFNLSNKAGIILNFILIFSMFLIIQTFLDFIKYFKKKHFNFSRVVSHTGFGFLIFFIVLNSIYSIEHDFNLKVGETKKFENYSIKFEDLKISSKKSYNSVIGYFQIFDNEKHVEENLRPEIRIYNQPQTITYEASISSNMFSNTYVTMSNLSDSEFYNIKFQKKPFINLIWLSVIVTALGGIFRLFRKQN